MIQDEDVYINGDGSANCDFNCVANLMKALLLAGTTVNSKTKNQAYNVAMSDLTTLNHLLWVLKTSLATHGAALATPLYVGHQQTR